MKRYALFLLGVAAQSVAAANLDGLASSASALIASLNDDQKNLAVHSLKTDARATWSNLPIVMAPPVGVLLADLSDRQRGLVHEMLQQTLSSQGYTKAAAIMWLDDILREEGQRRMATDEAFRANPLSVAMTNNRGSGNYAVAVFGDPGDDYWGWKITGHHLAVNVTVAGNRLTVLPGFYGSNPRVVQDGPYAGFSALNSEMSLGLRLMRSLDPAQRESALIGGERPEDVIEGPGRRGSLERFEGLQAKHMSMEQLGHLQRLVGEYLRNAEAASAAEQLDVIGRAGWDNVWFSWRGPLDGSGEFYYRVHGPRVLIEYNLQNPNHDHAVVRDPVNDYGEDWLGHHYDERHPSYDEYMGNFRRAAGVD